MQKKLNLFFKFLRYIAYPFHSNKYSSQLIFLHKSVVKRWLIFIMGKKNTFSPWMLLGFHRVGTCGSHVSHQQIHTKKNTWWIPIIDLRNCEAILNFVCTLFEDNGIYGRLVIKEGNKDCLSIPLAKKLTELGWKECGWKYLLSLVISDISLLLEASKRLASSNLLNSTQAAVIFSFASHPLAQVGLHLNDTLAANLITCFEWLPIEGSSLITVVYRCPSRKHAFGAINITKHQPANIFWFLSGKPINPLLNELTKQESCPESSWEIYRGGRGGERILYFNGN